MIERKRLSYKIHQMTHIVIYT